MYSRWRYAPESWLKSDSNQEKKKIAKVTSTHASTAHCLLASKVIDYRCLSKYMFPFCVTQYYVYIVFILSFYNI